MNMVKPGCCQSRRNAPARIWVHRTLNVVKPSYCKPWSNAPADWSCQKREGVEALPYVLR